MTHTRCLCRLRSRTSGGCAAVAGDVPVDEFFVVADAGADCIGDEPVWHAGRVVGWITSGGYAHHVGKSVALAYVLLLLFLAVAAPRFFRADALRAGRRGF